MSKKRNKLNFNDICDAVEKWYSEKKQWLPFVIVLFLLELPSLLIILRIMRDINPVLIIFGIDISEKALRFGSRIYGAFTGYLLHIVLFVAMRAVFRKKVHMPIELALLCMGAISLFFIIMDPFFSVGAVIHFDWALEFGTIFIFEAVFFSAFSAAIELLDCHTTLKDRLKIPIAFLVAIPAGLLVSRILWIPIMAFYLK